MFDFESGVLPPEFTIPSNTAIASTELYSGVTPSFGTKFLRNQDGGTPTGTPSGPITLTLTELGSHSSIDLNFLLAVIDAWDGTNGAPARDYLNVTVDSVLVFQGSWAQASGSGNSVPRYASGALCCTFGASYFNNDGAVDMDSVSALNGIPHTASSVTIKWFASLDFHGPEFA